MRIVSTAMCLTAFLAQSISATNTTDTTKFTNAADSPDKADSSNSRAQKDWELVWFDEFETDGPPNSEKWDYEEGFVRNEEMQYYTRGRPENARVENGVLVIEGRKEQFKNPRHKPGSNHWKARREYASYTSASLITLHKAGWRHGRIEVRAKVPSGKGVWPAIWTLGTNIVKDNWPRCGEIDIMEYVGKDPHRIHANAHFPVEGKLHSHGGKLTAESPYADFHLYALEWDEHRLDFFFDDIKYHTFEIDKAGKGEDNPFRQPHYLLINLALGGSWGGEIDDDAMPARYLIDYVRVYERKTRKGAKVAEGEKEKETNPPERTAPDPAAPKSDPSL